MKETLELMIRLSEISDNKLSAIMNRNYKRVIACEDEHYKILKKLPPVKYLKELLSKIENKVG